MGAIAKQNKPSKKPKQNQKEEIAVGPNNKIKMQPKINELEKEKSKK
jgi:hypothetical protein